MTSVKRCQWCQGLRHSTLRHLRHSDTNVVKTQHMHWRQTKVGVIDAMDEVGIIDVNPKVGVIEEVGVIDVNPKVGVIEEVGVIDVNPKDAGCH